MASVNVITLGCSKNLVDSERVISMLTNKGFEARAESNEPTDIVVINTCGFIGDAKEESVNTIMSYVDAKNKGIVGEIYVMGCLSERYRSELQREIPEVDRMYGKFDWDTLASDLAALHPEVEARQNKASVSRTVTTPAHTAYLKISEGCNRYCAFCAIPLITGRHVSRPMEDIENEVRQLVAAGVKEFNIIAQDLSSYGSDLYGELKLPELVARLADIDGVEWLRLHYAYPAQFPYGILEVMRTRPNVCTYLDIALQHISDKVLGNMRRHITGAQIRELLAQIRHEVPGIHLRTTLMVGFPGEDEEAFEELLQFVRSERFERMGAFAYCEEEGTFAAKNFTDSIPRHVKDERLEKLMALQEEISMEIQQQKVGQTLRVLVDREESDYYVGRTQWDSPEVDPEVLIRKSGPLTIGEFYDVKIVEALPFELIADLA